MTMICPDIGKEWITGGVRQSLADIARLKKLVQSKEEYNLFEAINKELHNNKE